MVSSFSKGKSFFEHISGCYVDSQRRRIAIYSEESRALKMEDRARYLIIIKKSMSGTVWRPLSAMPFTELGNNPVKAMHDKVLKCDNGEEEAEPVLDHIAATYLGRSRE